ncbi:MAG: hypothetical protein CML20_16540 [Rheinheimera sp.]|nr:hypothetical protein [Rheinheimera sp.]
MNYLRQYLIALILFGITAISQDAKAATDPCFYSKNQSASNCRHYAYDSLEVYFRDADNLEQKVIAKRVKSKSTQQLLHVNYDFQAVCNGTCIDQNTLAGEILWAFRNAIVENRLYVKEIIDIHCDPTMEVCCDDTGCNQIYGVNDTQDKSHTSKPKAGVKSEPITLAGKKSKKVDRAIQNTEATTNIMDNVVRNSRNPADFTEKCTTEVFVDMPAFSYSPLGTGNYKVCKLETSGYCEPIEGYLTEYENSGFAEFKHTQGQIFNEQLRSFVSEFFMQQRGMFCNQNMSCDAIGNCTVRMTCQRY